MGLVAGDATISDEETLKLYRAAEDLLAQDRAKDDGDAEVIEWAKAQPRSWLAMELDYDLSNLGKVLMGKLRPKRLLDRMSRLREKTDA